MVGQPKLPNGDPVKIELISEMGLVAASRVARGELKAEGWISQSSSLVNFTNNTRINLGPEQDECIPLFRTKYIVAARPEQAALIGARNGRFSWSRLLPEDPNANGAATRTTAGKASAEKSASTPDLVPLSLSHAQPYASTTGLGSLIQLAYAASNGAPLTVSLLKRPEIEAALQRYQREVFTYPLSESFLLSKTAASTGLRPRFAITTTQQLSQFNQLQSTSTLRLEGLSPIEGSYYEDYQLCTSDADWVSPGHRAALALFGDFLLAPDSQADAQRLGFEPPAGSAQGASDGTIVPSGTIASSSNPSNAPKNLGLESTEDITLPPVPGDVVSYLLDAWPRIRRPAAFILVLDASGSMDGDALMVGKEQFRRLIASTSNNDMKGLIVFNTNNELVAPLTKDSTLIFPKLDVVQALGGSGVYDGIRSALEIAQDPTLAPYRKMVVVFTDGNDKNSEISLTSLMSYARRVADESDVNLFIVGVDREGSDFSDLEKVAHEADGTFRRSALVTMETVFQEISKGF